MKVLRIFLLSLLCSGLGHSQLSDISWVSSNGVAELDDGSNKILSKVSKLKSWDQGARSKEVLSGDGGIVVSAGDVSNRSFIGFAKGVPSHDYRHLDYAVYFNDGVLRIYEKGVKIVSLSAYKEEDVITISRVGGVVTYKIDREGTTQDFHYTSEVPYNGGLYAACSFYTRGSHIRNPKSFGFTNTDDQDEDGLLDSVENEIIAQTGNTLTTADIVPEKDYDQDGLSAIAEQSLFGAYDFQEMQCF